MPQRPAPRHAAGIASLAVNKADPKVLQDLFNTIGPR
jgi:hypothetical protein